MGTLQKYALKLYIFTFVIGLPGKVFAQSSDIVEGDASAGTGLSGTREAAGYSDIEVEVVVGELINAVLGVLGVAFVILLVYAGILYLTAQGDMDQVEKAKRLIRQAVIGMIIIASSFVIAEFVLDELIRAVGGGES